MHDTALQVGSKFIATYASPERRLVLEIGALDVNGSLRQACPEYCIYFGADMEHGTGVDIKVDPTRPLPLRSGFSDLTISTSQMEHDPRFWNTFLEMCRVTRKGGFIYFSAPSNGPYHRFPIDVWRFYPDAGHALVAWAKENTFEITLLESFIVPRQADIWNDFVAIFYVGRWNPDDKIDFLADHFAGYNAWKHGSQVLQNVRKNTEDWDLFERSIVERNKLTEEVKALRTREAQMAGENEMLKHQLAATDARLAQAMQNPVPAAPATTPAQNGVYDQDGLRSVHNHDFKQDAAFVRAYARGVAAAGSDYNWHWRVHVGLWAAETARKVDGDFIECGVNRGFLSSAIMSHLDWNRTGRTFYLLDTFSGIDTRYLSEADRAQGVEERNRKDLESGFYTTSVAEIEANFAEWPTARIIKGAIPETLSQVDAKRIAFLHLDLNCSLPEIATLNLFWERLSPGAVVLMDDYAYRGYESQKIGADAFARAHGVTVLSLPTGQGLLIKPPAATAATSATLNGTSLPKDCLGALQEGHLRYQYKGIETLKCPFDLALYALLLWKVRPRTIFEIGSNRGGSAIWLADHLRAYGIDGHVFSFDIKPVEGLEHDLVTFGAGDAMALGHAITPAFLESLPRPFLVIEDSSHQRAASLAVMNFFDQHLRDGEYLIVEDAIVTDLGMAGLFDGGPGAAIAEFLSGRPNWQVDRAYCDFFGANVTWNVNGYLRKGQASN